MPRSRKPKTQFKITCYRCGNETSKTFLGSSRELTEKMLALKDRYKCKKCGSRSFRYRTVY